MATLVRRASARCGVESELASAIAGRWGRLQRVRRVESVSFRSSWSGSGCWFEASDGTPVSLLFCMFALLFSHYIAFSPRPKKKSSINWEEKAMNTITSMFWAVASLGEWSPLQTRTSGSRSRTFT